MILSDFEKEILLKMKDEKITHLDWFFSNFIKFTKINHHFTEYDFLGYKINQDTKSYELIDIEETICNISNFIALMDILRNANLMYVVNLPYKTPLLLFKRDQNNNRVTFDILMGVYLEYSDNIFVTTNDFKKFIENGFKTQKETTEEQDKIDREEERKDRVKAQRWTVGIGISSLVITVLFQFLFSSDDRKVQIVNARDTTKVLVINPDEQKVFQTTKRTKHNINIDTVQFSKK